MFLHSSKLQPGKQSSVDEGKEKEKLIKKPLFSIRERRILALLVVVSFLAAFTSTGWEITELAKNKARNIVSGHLAKAKDSQQAGPVPPVHPVYFFPKEVKGYTVFGRQKVRGEENYAAEAIFKPEDEKYTLVEPLNVYVKIIYCGSDEAAQKAIDSLMTHRKITQRINVEIIGIKINAGYTEDHGTLIMAWVKNGYAVEINASYTEVIPQVQTDSLEKNAVEVAKEVWEKMSSGH